jgi:hypothetical protein
MNEDDGRSATRRGAEHVRVADGEDANGELGEIVPPPVRTDDGHVEVLGEREEDERDDER